MSRQLGLGIGILCKSCRGTKKWMHGLNDVIMLLACKKEEIARCSEGRNGAHLLRVQSLPVYLSPRMNLPAVAASCRLRGSAGVRPSPQLQIDY